MGRLRASQLAASLRRPSPVIGSGRGLLLLSAAAALPPATSSRVYRQLPLQQQQQPQQQVFWSGAGRWASHACTRPRSCAAAAASCSSGSRGSSSTAGSSAAFHSPAAPAAAAEAEAAEAGGSSERAAADSATAAAAARPAYSFKSEAHRAMVIACTRLRLQDLLLQRFAAPRTAESRALLRGRGVRRLLLLWAELLVQQNPDDPPADAFFVPPQLYRLKETQALLEEDGEARWLLRRIDPGGAGGLCDSSSDCLPVPTYPSVLQQQLPLFPFEPQQIEYYRDTYGLLKWPFKPVPSAAGAAAAAGGEGEAAAASAAVPQIAAAEPTPEGVAAAVAAVAAAVERGDVRRANSKALAACNTAALYAPDETETAPYVLQ
ncbi:hypothetical protein Efla_005825 [Eimeria flavescens]